MKTSDTKKVIFAALSWEWTKEQRRLSWTTFYQIKPTDFCSPNSLFRRLKNTPNEWSLQTTNRPWSFIFNRTRLSWFMPEKRHTGRCFLKNNWLFKPFVLLIHKSKKKRTWQMNIIFQKKYKKIFYLLKNLYLCPELIINLL